MSGLGREVNLSEVCDTITYGYTASATNINTETKFLRITDIVPSQIDWESVPYCEIDLNNLAKYKLQVGDIVIARTGATTGWNKTIKSLPYPTVYASYLIKYSINREIANPFYVGYNLRSSKWYDYVDAIAGGSAQPGANAKQLGSFNFNLPLLPEQKAIASVLSSLDNKIDLLHRQNKTLESMAETMFRQWFIEEAQEDWKEISLDQIFDFLEGPGIRNWQYVSSGINFINIRLISNGEIFVSKANKISKEEALGKYIHFMLKEDDFVLSTSGTLGKSAIVRSYHLPLCLNTSVIRFRPKSKLYREFMYSYLSSRKFLDEVENSASGSVQLNFGPTHIKNITLYLPDPDTLMKYHTSSKPIFDKIKSNFQQINCLEHLRDTLLPKLMSGEVRVQYAEEKIESVA
ncbi:restriction endonuclease subunit S [Raoultella ornithinolytica]|uniref:restriction endonuclease subunit S n=1 Tax=Raoultella ornithinolytica TaxID=54291 RepID=UPI00301E2BDD